MINLNAGQYYLIIVIIVDCEHLGYVRHVIVRRDTPRGLCDVTYQFRPINR